MKKTLLYAGSFDPPTYAHVDLIKRGAELSDKLLVVIAHNPSKLSFLPIKRRVQLLKDLTKKWKNVQVSVCEGLISKFAREKRVDYFIRGIRSEDDFESEYAMSVANEILEGIPTIFLLSKPEFRHISGTLVREIALFKGELKSFVPPNVVQAIKTRLAS